MESLSVSYDNDLHEQVVPLPKLSPHRLTSQTSQKYNRSIVILRRALLRIFER